MEKYSVLMTVYAKDDPEFFSLALSSMAEQTYLPDEIVLVKDGPIPDALQQVIDKAVEAGTPIVSVQLEKNKGLGLALNEGIKVVKNDLIARMDSDDYSLPERCEKQVKEFEKNPKLAIVGCPVLEFTYRGAKKRPPDERGDLSLRQETGSLQPPHRDVPEIRRGESRLLFRLPKESGHGPLDQDAVPAGTVHESGGAALPLPLRRGDL